MNQLNASAVEQWLIANPDFFLGREQLLSSLQLNHACGDAESLLTYQLKLLRDQVNQQEERYQELLGNARDNEKRLRRIERLLVSLLETQTTEELVTVLSERLKEDFRLPYLKIWSYTNLNSLPRAQDTLAKAQQQLLDQQQACCLELDSELKSLLGFEQQNANSAALCLLSHTRPLGLMVLAHPNPGHFRHQDTRFIEYLGSIVSRLLSKDRRYFDQTRSG